MDPKHRQAIKSNADYLKSIDKNELRPFIEKSKLFTRSMLNDIFDTEEACFIEELPTRGPKAFDIFLKVLEDAGQDKAVKKLKESVATHNSLNVNAGQVIKKLEESVGGKEISNSLNTDINSHCYEMSPSTIGDCLIINNVDFPKRKRNWSDEDAKDLYHAFSKLGYNITIKNNLEEDKMHSTLKDFANKGDLDSCVVIVLSYGGEEGNQEIIYGTDGGFVYVYEIIKLFGNKNPKFYEKPKLFFLPRGNTRTDDTDSVAFHEKNDDLYKCVFIHYFPSEEVEGKSYMREFSKILLENYKTEDLETIMRKVMNACPSFITKSVGHGLKGIHFKKL
ncbi:caspase-9-like [Stegodyphus dumicola]|uniref:caspase-9-like n=1 Tax=Stegodyphus dumicola TaxID=202533 RepID=UPI0015B1D123|nr:caspase-9-like [Stegodyphus dumicola]